jgi:capsular exopolysaccharide synthesis family protein
MGAHRTPQLPAPAGRRLAPVTAGAPAIRSEPAQQLVAYAPLIEGRAILRAIYRNRYLILAILAASILLGALSIILSPKIYQSTSMVLIGEEVQSPVEIAKNGNTILPQDVDRTLQTQVDMLATRDMAVGVLDRLMAQGGARAQVAERTTPEDLQTSLQVYLPRNSRIVSISYDDRSPQVAALIANNYAEALIERNLQTKFNASDYARKFLQKQLEISKGRLELSERAMIAYARAAGLLDASGGMNDAQHAPRSLTTANLLQLNDAYAQAKSNRIQAQQKWQQAQAAPLMSLPEVLANPTVQGLNEQKAEAQAKLQELRQKYKEEHPLVQQAAANINELDRQINAVALSAKNSIRDQYMVAARQESALAGSVGELKGQTLAEQDRSVRYTILGREVDTNRELYDGLLQRYKQVSAEAGGTSNNIAIVDRAIPASQPISPSKSKNMSLSLAGGAIFAFLLVFVRERLDHRVSEPASVGQEVAVPLLAVIPKVKDVEGPSEALCDSCSELSEACHSLRTAIELGCEGETPESILFTSSKSQEGKTTTALGLARAFAQSGKRVLLVDGDMRKPTLHQHDGIDNVAGFSDLLSGEKELREVIKRSETFEIDMLTSGSRPSSPAALLDPERVRAVTDAALQTYDHVIIDGPPTLGLADAVRLAAAVDATVFVVKSEGVTRDEARFALGRLRSQHSLVIGAVLTMFEAHRSLSSQYYTYNYSEGSA